MAYKEKKGFEGFMQESLGLVWNVNVMILMASTLCNIEHRKSIKLMSSKRIGSIKKVKLLWGLDLNYCAIDL